jgi:hypothetical protein
MRLLLPLRDGVLCTAALFCVLSWPVAELLELLSCCAALSLLLR